MSAGETTYETVLLERHDRVALVTLNRPKALNALSLQVMEEITALLGELDRDPEPGLGVLPHYWVLPHFDRMSEWEPALLDRIAPSVPEGVTLLGIDEDTALVQLGDGCDLNDVDVAREDREDVPDGQRAGGEHMETHALSALVAAASAGAL